MTVIRDSLSKPQFNNCIADLKAKWPYTWKPDIQEERWKEEEDDDLEKNTAISTLRPVEITKLEYFLSTFKRFQKQSAADSRAKIAILDSGVDRSIFKAEDATIIGTSFAIEWAVRQKVEIINLSLVLFEDKQVLWNAIQKAKAAEVLAICSTADQGFIRQDVWPAKYGSTNKANTVVIPIAACKANGKITEFSSETTAAYVLQGENVDIAETPVSGSSVATAIATGVASLVLACHRILRSCESSSPYASMSNYSLITNVFSKMSDKPPEKDQPQIVMPWLVFPTKKLKEGSPGTHKSDFTLSEPNHIETWITGKFWTLLEIFQAQPG